MGNNLKQKLFVAALLVAISAGTPGCAAVAVGAAMGAGGYELFQQHQKNKEQDKRLDYCEGMSQNHEERLLEAEGSLRKHRVGLDYLHGKITPYKSVQGHYKAPTADWLEELNKKGGE